MRAAVYYGRRDVRVMSWPEPRLPAPDELQLEVIRASLCGTDVDEYIHGPTLIPLDTPHPASGHSGPLVLGHEILGRVVAVGSAVEDFTPGDRVTPGSGVSCGYCGWCISGRSNLCRDYYTVGLHRDGGLAELVNVPARICRPVPSSCSDDVAVLAQPLAVALHAVRRTRAERGARVAVIGAGGVGQLIIAVLAARGVHVIAVDVATARLTTARRLGADQFVNAIELDAAAAIRDLTDEGADAVIEASGTPEGLATALAAVRRGGQVQVVGLQRQPQPVDISRLVLQEVEISSSKVHVCDVDLPAALDILGRYDLTPALDSVIELDAVVALGLERLARGGGNGRVVVRFDGAGR